MNVFVLDEDIVLAVRYHCDRHVVKMVLESAQMLSTVQRMSGNNDEALYKSTHVKHPWVIWTAESRSNYLWHYEFFHTLAYEYWLRYGKNHSSYIKLGLILRNCPALPDIGLSKMPLAMPEKYKCENVVESYRNYYVGMKLHFAVWSEPREEPEWIKNWKKL